MTTDNRSSQNQSEAAPSPDHPEYWQTRGIGSDWNLTCLATGEQHQLMPNISGFVRSREAGERVVALFGGRARLDFRSSEPNWIQVKVGAVEQHKDVLGRLAAASYACGGMIDAKVIAWAIDPVGKPGFQPNGLRAVDELQAKLDQVQAERDDLLRHRSAESAARLEGEVRALDDRVIALLRFLREQGGTVDAGDRHLDAWTDDREVHPQPDDTINMAFKAGLAEQRGAHRAYLISITAAGSQALARIATEPGRVGHERFR